MESVFPVSRDVYAGQYRPASLQANPQHIWQQHRRTGLQPVGAQAYKEPVSSPSSSALEAWKRQNDTLSRIIMRQEDNFLGLEDEVKTSKREIQRLGYLAEARNQHIQHLEHQLAQTEAKNQQLSHEIFVLRHTAQSGAMHAKLPPADTPQGSCVPTQERAFRGTNESDQRQGSQISIKSERDGEESS
ncbi:hypothetical protein M441DRAFT_132702 [Trichoderma asperellum CBS 433.97]|uniref:Uncharacterized protein n=1 Tax=Trichoderma asperellum (strain ATCC 204424 / CBS 433.97 / NBRC 101777) TaxID=1042311 RepID=A0A2T3ZGA6_TRIA4|nr:hypothetical protein M441DRAFT_132702 [Trichoderma asperellum CBS 433.97]PTB43819.1 hypothetical protein M441DRAFT_132702 [Trichoderma asperellum CBS 433.97]